MVPAMESNVDYVLGSRVPEPGDPIEIAPGILWIRLPMPLALDHVNLYLLEDGDGWTLVDCGLADPGTRAVWERLLATRLNGRPITRIVVTHFHPDHVGMAGWLQERTGAGLWMSRVEWLMARSTWLDTESDRSPQMQEFYRRAGFDEQDIQAHCELGNDYRGMVTPIPVSYSRITRQTGFRIGDRLWRPVFGSGHSPDHVALYCERDKVLLGGDMLLPRITPIIAVWWQEPDADPLSDYLEFLGSLGEVADDALVLPAHNRPYRELRTRIVDLGRHHETRLALTLDACSEPATAAAVMRTLFPRELDTFQSRFAIGETIAHINRLLATGGLVRGAGGNGCDLYRCDA